MKLSKLIHVASVVFGFIGLLMWVLVLLVWPADAVWFGVTRNLMIVCAVFSFLTAIWLQIATIHHMMLEKRGEIV
jgi:hypothetical protein